MYSEEIAPKKRTPVPRLIQIWLSINRHGRLASDQWLTLVTAPLWTLLTLAIPVILLFSLPQMRVLLRAVRLMPLLLLALLAGGVIMFVLRARRYARAPLYSAVVYAGDSARRSWWGRLRRRMEVYDEQDEPLTFNNFIETPPALVPEIPYLVYYLEDLDQRTLLSYAPLEHPDIALWEPSDKFKKRQQNTLR